MKVLDHGYITLVETWGSDENIIESARMSTNKGFFGWGTKETPGDEKLLRYLYTHNHTSPFEMAGAIFEVQAPIFVFREWHRHRTQSFNEMSARYAPLPNVNYIPTVERLMMTGGANKQAQGAKEVRRIEAELFQQSLRESYIETEALYQTALGDGIPKELARLVLPVGRYSKMRASANLLNWIRFMRLRCDRNAQWEIQQYAYSVLKILAGKFPRTIQLFEEELEKQK